MSYVYPTVPITTSAPSVSWPTYTYTMADPDTARMRLALELIASGHFLSDDAAIIAAKALRQPAPDEDEGDTA